VFVGATCVPDLGGSTLLRFKGMCREGNLYLPSTLCWTGWDCLHEYEVSSVEKQGEVRRICSHCRTPNSHR
jgi:hypothetical protein